MPVARSRVGCEEGASYPSYQDFPLKCPYHPAAATLSGRPARTVKCQTDSGKCVLPILPPILADIVALRPALPRRVGVFYVPP